MTLNFGLYETLLLAWSGIALLVGTVSIILRERVAVVFFGNLVFAAVLGFYGVRGLHSVIGLGLCALSLLHLWVVGGLVSRTRPSSVATSGLRPD